MLNILKTTTLEAISAMTVEQRYFLHDELNDWFNEDTKVIESASDLNDEIWSYDPIATSGGVIAFCVENSLLPDDACYADITHPQVSTRNSGCAPVRGQPTSGWHKLGSAARDRAIQRSQNFF